MSHREALVAECERAQTDLVSQPTLANEDPYGAGWLVIVKPEDWAAAKSTLVPGTQVAGPYEAKMNADGFAGCACAPGAQP